MNGQAPSGSGSRRGGRRRKPKAVQPSTDLWRAVPPVPEPKPIVPAADPTLLLRSLGPPPLVGQGAVAQHYLAYVIDKAVGGATALAEVAGVLATAVADDPDDGD